MTIERVEFLGPKGEGVVHTAAGDVRVTKVLAGEMIELDGNRLGRVVTSSPDRVVPFCKHHDTCGGCSLQHWNEKPYQDWKRERLVSALARMGLDAPVAPLVDAHGSGRRRVTLHVRNLDGLWQAGFMEQRSHSLCAISDCPVLVPSLTNAPVIAADFGAVLGACDVALTLADNGLDAAIKAERQTSTKRHPRLLEIFSRHHLVRLSVNNEVLVEREQPIVRMGKVSVPLPIQSFLQATSRGEEILQRLVQTSLGARRRVADLFCGIGTFALLLAETSQVSAFDSDASAVSALDRARRMAKGLKPVQPQVRNLFTTPLVTDELKPMQAVVLDPPRSGAEAQCRELARSSVPVVAYVSCDVQSFARDAAILVKGGFSLKRATPVDQFKWTSHLEMMGHFERPVVT